MSIEELETMTYEDVRDRLRDVTTYAERLLNIYEKKFRKKWLYLE